MINAELRSGTLGAFAVNHPRVLFASLTSPDSPNNPLFDPMALNEAMADLVSSQTAGGGNRLTTVNGTYPGDGVGVSPTGRLGETYCAPAGAAATGTGLCFDVNLNGTEANWPGLPVNDEVGRYSTLFMDLIDDTAVLSGNVREHGGVVWVPNAGACTNGQMTCPNAALGVMPGPTLGFTEEPVALPFTILQQGIDAWIHESRMLESVPFMRGMTRALDAAGVSRANTCAVYALHTPGRACDPQWLP